MVATLHLPAPVFCQAFHPSQPFFAVGCLDGTIRVYKYSDSGFVQYLEFRETAGCRALQYNDEYLLIGLRSGAVILRTATGGVETLRASEKNTPVSSVLWLSPKLFCVGYEDGKMHIFNNTREKPFWCEINEYKDPVVDMALHPDGKMFYAIGAGQLGLFRIENQQYGTRLEAMSDPYAEDFESILLVNDGKHVLCTCADLGVAIFNSDNLAVHVDRIAGLRYAVHSMIPLRGSHILLAGEAGQILVAQICPTRINGVFAEISAEALGANDDSEGDSESSDGNIGASIDSMARDPAGTIVTIVDNSSELVLIQPLKPAFDICQGIRVGQLSTYAEFMDEL